VSHYYGTIILPGLPDFKFFRIQGVRFRKRQTYNADSSKDCADFEIFQKRRKSKPFQALLNDICYYSLMLYDNNMGDVPVRLGMQAKFVGSFLYL